MTGLLPAAIRASPGSHGTACRQSRHIRAGFRALLNAEAHIEVVGEAADGATAVAMARQHRADVILMDIRMPNTDGIEATRRISADEDLAGVKDHHPHNLRVRRLHIRSATGRRQRIPGQRHRTSRTRPRRASRRRRRSLALSQCHPPADHRHRLPTREQIGKTSGDGLERLTPREHEVLTLVAEGLSNDEIAVRLYLSP